MSLVFAHTLTHEQGSQEDWEAGRPWPPADWPPGDVPDVRNEPRYPARESQYIGSYLAATADPATRWTPATYLSYTLRGRAKDWWSSGYSRALWRAINRRVRDRSVIAVRSKGGSTAYIRRPS